jgi:prepilin-type N-terminal cleavage/methylation domain-containing protein
MKLNTNNTKKSQGFTLIEMIGVLAVIAILAAVLIPKVFDAINSSRINNASITCQTAKTAIADHYAKFGSLNSSNSVPITAPITQFDEVLLKEGFLDKMFHVKISATTNGPSGTRVELQTAAAASVLPSAGAGNLAYALGGNTGVNDATGSLVVQAVIPAVTESDARDLSLRVDGDSMSTALGTSDFNGRVKYATGSPTIVYVYLTHR